MASDARRLLAAMYDGARARFDRALERAELADPVHEENEFFTLSVPLGLASLALLEIGRRLAGRGIVDHPDDVFFLTDREARAALADSRPGDADGLRGAASGRKADRARAREFGIPAVVATGNATQLLTDGQLVTVDGDAGLVTVSSSPA